MSTDTVTVRVMKGVLTVGDIDPAGAPAIAEQIFAQGGALSLTSAGNRWYAPTDMTISTVIASVGTASSSGSVTVDVKKNGTTILTLTLASGEHKVEATPGVPELAEGDYLTVIVTATGTSAAGLTVQILF